MKIDEIIEAKSKEEFNHNIWSYDHILEALTSPEGITKFVTYKFNSTPTDINVPVVINTKFRYRDTRFFITFTRNKKFMSLHQIEYKKLFT